MEYSLDSLDRFLNKEDIEEIYYSISHITHQFLQDKDLYISLITIVVSTVDLYHMSEIYQFSFLLVKNGKLP